MLHRLENRWMEFLRTTGQFNRKLEDTFEVQAELARQISENLRLRLTPSR
jgi:TolB-like protein